LDDGYAFRDLERRIGRVEAQLDGKVFVSTEVFDLVIRALRDDIEEHNRKHSQLRFLVASAILSASLSLVVGLVVLFVSTLGGH
jgi:hypothetical protein